MALIVSATSGNFNSTSTWVGGVVPTVGDEARASNGHTVTITANVTCDELSNDGTGTFILNAGVTLNANVTHKTATALINVLTFSAASPAVSTINGTIRGRTVAGDRGSAISITGTGTLNINGDVIAGIQISVNGIYGAILINANCRLNIVGNVSGGSFTSASGINFSGGNSCVLTITGNVVGGNAATTHGIFCSTLGTINITGNVTGGTVSNGVNTNNASNVNITGIITGGAGAAALALNGINNIIGPLYASEFASAIAGGSRTQQTLLTGPFYMSPILGVQANTALAWRWAASLNPNTFIEIGTSDLLAKRNFVTPDNATNFPAAIHVRNGTAYGISGALVGSCFVPPSGSVRLGVPVDNTTGIAILDAAGIWNYMVSNLTTSGSIGARLKNIATTQSVGDIFSAQGG